MLSPVSVILSIYQPCFRCGSPIQSTRQDECSVAPQPTLCRLTLVSVFRGPNSAVLLVIVGTDQCPDACSSTLEGGPGYLAAVRCSPPTALITPLSTSVVTTVGVGRRIIRYVCRPAADTMLSTSTRRCRLDAVPMLTCSTAKANLAAWAHNLSSCSTTVLYLSQARCDVRSVGLTSGRGMLCRCNCRVAKLLALSSKTLSVCCDLRIMIFCLLQALSLQH